MAKTANVTVTGITGPGSTVTALALPNSSQVRFDIDRNTFTVVKDGSIKTFDYNTTATVTFTISSNTATIAIS